MSRDTQNRPPVVHSVALSLQSDDLGVVQEAIKDSTGGRGVSEHLAPVLQGPIGSQDDRPFFVTACEDLEQVLCRCGRQALHSQVLQHQEVYFAELSVGSVMAVGVTGAILGPIFAGYTFDVTGSYQLAMIGCVILCVVSILFSLRLLRSKGKE